MLAKWKAWLLVLVIAAFAPWGAGQEARAGEPVNCEDRPGECPLQPSVAEINLRLGSADVGAWSEGDVFIVARRSTAAPQLLCCSVRGILKPVPGANLAIIRLKIPDLEEAIIDYVVTEPGMPATLTIWRGPKSPTILAPPLSALSGRIETISLESATLKQRRALSIYLPPGHSPQRHYPVIYMADGYGLEEYARYADSLIAAGKLSPVILVGVWNAAIPDPSRLPGKGKMLPAQDLRAAEYLWDGVEGNEAFLANEKAFLYEVVPFVESRFSVLKTCSGRVLAGFSDGAAWAFSTSVRHPRFACNAILLSFGWSPALKAVEDGELMKVRFFVEAGTLEPTRLSSSEELVSRTRRAGGAATFTRYVAGHSSTTAIQTFGASLVALFEP